MCAARLPGGGVRLATPAGQGARCGGRGGHCGGLERSPADLWARAEDIIATSSELVRAPVVRCIARSQTRAGGSLGCKRRRVRSRPQVVRAKRLKTRSCTTCVAKSACVRPPNALRARIERTGPGRALRALGTHDVLGVAASSISEAPQCWMKQVRFADRTSPFRRRTIEQAHDKGQKRPALKDIVLPWSACARAPLARCAAERSLIGVRDARASQALPLFANLRSREQE